LQNVAGVSAAIALVSATLVRTDTPVLPTVKLAIDLGMFSGSRFPRLVGRPAIGPMAYILSAANNAAAASSVVDQGLCKAVTELFLWTAGIDDRPGTSQQMTFTRQAHA
jgi:hypothetical protein